MRAQVSLGPGLVGVGPTEAASCHGEFLDCRLPSETLPLLPSQMTDETIGDPSTSSGRPRARVMTAPAGTTRRRGHRRAHLQAAAQPIMHALSPHQARTYRRRIPPAQEQDRKMTGSFTRPTGRTSRSPNALGACVTNPDGPAARPGSRCPAAVVTSRTRTSSSRTAPGVTRALLPPRPSTAARSSRPLRPSRRLLLVHRGAWQCQRR